MTGMFLNFLSTGMASSSGGVDGRLPSWSHLSFLAHEAGRPRSIREEAVAAQKEQQSGKLPVWEFTVPDAMSFLRFLVLLVYMFDLLSI
jgi:hypothetical protein